MHRVIGVALAIDQLAELNGPCSFQRPSSASSTNNYQNLSLTSAQAYDNLIMSSTK
jgi:hypothetical protein